jgi:hypothetical protein
MVLSTILGQRCRRLGACSAITQRALAAMPLTMRGKTPRQSPQRSRRKDMSFASSWSLLLLLLLLLLLSRGRSGPLLGAGRYRKASPRPPRHRRRL